MTHWMALPVLLVACGSENGLNLDLPWNGEMPGTAEDLPPGYHQDAFNQVAATDSDVLFVVDNSNSMGGEQDDLAENFPRFLTWFQDSGVNYHIGVVTTDMYDRDQAGQLMRSEGHRWIAPDTPDAAFHFARMSIVGDDGANDERGRAAAFTALELREREANDGFLRRNADLHIVVVSDEEDGSGNDPISLPEWIQYLQNLKGRDQVVTHSSVVGTEDRGGGFFGCNTEEGSEYLEVTEQVGGVAWSICDGDWDELLDELGFLAAGLRRAFPLSRDPVPDTIEVAVYRGREALDLGDEDDAWRYDEPSNQVIFEDFLPPAESRVVIRYEVAQ